MSFVGAPIPDHAARKEAAIALTCGSISLSWTELAACIARLASKLRVASGPQARIALLLDDPVERLVAFLACAASGQVAMVGDPAWGREKQTFVIRMAEPALVLTGLEDGTWPAADIDGRPGVADATLPFYVGFTSGSTGAPKAFRRSHRSWLESFALSERSFGLCCADRIMIPGDLSHSLHLYGAVQAVHMGARTRLARRFTPRAIVRAMAKDNSTVLYATPTQLQLVCKAAVADGIALPDVARILVSGSKWRQEKAGDVEKAFPNARLYEFYGTSETSFIAARGPGDQAPDKSVGRALPGIDIRIRDEAGRPLPIGETGRIWVKSDLLFDGYEFGGGDETRWEDGWLTVGDRGALDEKGFLFLAGRGKRMLVSAGVNVYAEEIEAILESDPRVIAAAVFGMDDPLRGHRIVAAVKCAVPLAPDELRRLCLAKLEAIKVPRHIHIMGDWPLTAGGKTDLQHLEALVATREGAS